jgi:hypothetical protein
MTTDLYTKAVLTVIALSLATIALQHVIPSAFAQSGIQKVMICDPKDHSECSRVGPAFGTNGALNVIDVMAMQRSIDERNKKR